MDLWKRMSALWDLHSDAEINPYCDITRMLTRMLSRREVSTRQDAMTYLVG